ncbi:nuclease-related domain-containing protein [Luteimonas sp. e5]
MKRITLSDHTADQINAAVQERKDAYSRAMEQFEAAQAAQQARVDEARRASREAWEDRKIAKALWNWWVGQWRSMVGWPTPPQMRGETEQERIWAVGNEGEERVADHLARFLPDTWTLFGGYRNPKGEIDQVLVGPGGLFTIEIKNINGVVTVIGDSFTSDKYDNYGNLKETGKQIADRRGRSPSRQLNEPTDKLVEFLQRSVPGVRAHRVVVLSHQKSAIARLDQPAAEVVVLSDWDLARTISQGQALPDSDLAKVLDTIKRDHAHHARRHQQRRMAHAAPRAAAG